MPDRSSARLSGGSSPVPKASLRPARDHLPGTHLFPDQARQDGRLQGVGGHRAEVVAVVGEVGERGARVVRADLRDAGRDRRGLRDRDRASRRQRAEDAVGALRDELARRVDAALGGRGVVGVLDLQLDVVHARPPQRPVGLLDRKPGGLRVRGTEHGGRACERHDDADAEGEPRLTAAARGRRRDRGREHGHQRQRGGQLREPTHENPPPSAPHAWCATACRPRSDPVRVRSRMLERIAGQRTGS